MNELIWFFFRSFRRTPESSVFDGVPAAREGLDLWPCMDARTLTWMPARKSLRQVPWALPVGQSKLTWTPVFTGVTTEFYLFSHLRVRGTSWKKARVLPRSS